MQTLLQLISIFKDIYVQKYITLIRVIRYNIVKCIAEEISLAFQTIFKKCFFGTTSITYLAHFRHQNYCRQIIGTFNSHFILLFFFVFIYSTSICHSSSMYIGTYSKNKCFYNHKAIFHPTHTYTYTHVHLHTYTHTHVHLHTWTHIHMKIYTQTHNAHDL